MCGGRLVDRNDTPCRNRVNLTTTGRALCERIFLAVTFA